jgi:hypothetical protein
MPSPRVERLLHEIEGLSPDEQREIRQTLDRPSAVDVSPTPLERLLMQEGLLKRAALPERRRSFFQRYPPVPVAGDPISEIIIRVRR